MKESKPNYGFYSESDIEEVPPPNWVGLLRQLTHIRDPTSCLFVFALITLYLGKDWMSVLAMTLVFILGCLRYTRWREEPAALKKYDLT